MPIEKIQNHAAVEKPSTKPGRKPLMSEPKNKRTAQNRAAQRAFRERKEKRMKELEDQVRRLEEEKSLISNETELLRLQVKSLLKSLNKGKSTGNNESDFQIDDHLFETLNNKSTNLTARSRSQLEEDLESGNDSSPSTNHEYSDDKTSNSNMSSNSSVTSNTPGSFIVDDPFKMTNKNYTFNVCTPDQINMELKNKVNNTSYKDEYNEKIFCQELNKACGSKSCPIPKTKSIADSKSSAASNSPHGLSSTGSMMFKSPLSEMTPFSNANDKFTPSLYNECVNGEQQNSLFDMNKNETNELSSFWNYENEISITNKVPDINPTSSDIEKISMENNTNNEMNFLFSDSDKIKTETDKIIENNPSAFQLVSTPSLFDDQMDFNLDYDFENDAFDDLLQKSIDDPINKSSLPNINNEMNFDSGEPVTNNNPITEIEDEKIPDNTVDLMKCSQIWERITTHPRFTEIDIDNLCDELKQKAKCSESGVVVNGCDVGDLLKKAMKDEQKGVKIDEIKQHDLYLKKAAISDTSKSFLHGMW